ncbi:MAG: 2-hydroxyacyl-CoA dehydratase [Candidatus Thorarchaeota archaeon]|jgi:benzoyl-CoA reductase/2-hydroxyglutaryl-CoA dehydratase subunit BcrC/BadD/HgdB
MTDWPGLKRLRFDSELKTFDGIMSLYLSSAERARKSGKKVIAKGPLAPVEPIFAAGALAYDPFTHETIEHAIMEENTNLTSYAVDAGLSSDFNPWNLVMLGAISHGQNKVAIDALSTTCGCWDEQIKKSWQIMAEATTLPLYFWEVPRFDSQSEEWAIKYLVDELKQLLNWLASITGRKTSADDMRESVRRGNQLRQDLLELTGFLQLPSVPIRALEYYMAQALIGDYAQDPVILHESYRALIQELNDRVKHSSSSDEPAPDNRLRVFFMGEETQEFKVWNTIEDCGGSLVGCDTRLSLYYEPIIEEGPILENLAKWIWKMPCNMPTAARIRETIPFIRKQNANAVIINSVVGSRYLPEAERLVRDMIKDELGVPVLSIESTLPAEDTEKTEYQIRAFMEMNQY